MYKYKYYNSDNKVIAVSTFAGKPVRGVAKCNPNDTFSLEDGKALAEVRCDKKIATKRLKSAKAKLENALAVVKAARAFADNMIKYYDTAVAKLEEVTKAEEELLVKLSK